LALLTLPFILKGDVIFVNQTTGLQQQLTYVNSAGNGIIKVDNTTFVPYNQKRNAVMIASNDQYDFGTLWVFDALHVPYGCRWVPPVLLERLPEEVLMLSIAYGEHTGVEVSESRGLPVSINAAMRPRSDSTIAGGEIDIFEGINLATRNGMALHTTPGCTQPQGVTQTGTQASTNCDYSLNGNSGCAVQDSNTNSYGAAFAQAGGGVWVTEFAETGINIWFFSVRTPPLITPYSRN